MGSFPNHPLTIIILPFHTNFKCYVYPYVKFSEMPEAGSHCCLSQFVHFQNSIMLLGFFSSFYPLIIISYLVNISFFLFVLCA